MKLAAAIAAILLAGVAAAAAGWVVGGFAWTVPAFLDVDLAPPHMRG